MPIYPVTNQAGLYEKRSSAGLYLPPPDVPAGYNSLKQPNGTPIKQPNGKQIYTPE